MELCSKPLRTPEQRHKKKRLGSPRGQHMLNEGELGEERAKLLVPLVCAGSVVGVADRNRCKGLVSAHDGSYLACAHNLSVIFFRFRVKTKFYGDYRRILNPSS